MAERILITGSNRGIGLALVRQYLGNGATHVFATCRQPERADGLKALQDEYGDKLHIIALDVNDAASIDAAVARVSSVTDALDILINNAGIFPDEDRHAHIGDLNAERFAHILQTNSIAPMMVTQAFIDLVANGNQPRIMMVSSNMGSLANTRSSNAYGYRTSKAALNMMTRVLASDVRSRGITVVTAHPGWVQTDMGGSSASITPEESARGLINVLHDVSPDESGDFFNYNGDTLPW